MTNVNEEYLSYLKTVLCDDDGFDFWKPFERYIKEKEFADFIVNTYKTVCGNSDFNDEKLLPGTDGIIPARAIMHDLLFDVYSALTGEKLYENKSLDNYLDYVKKVVFDENGFDFSKVYHHYNTDCGFKNFMRIYAIQSEDLPVHTIMYAGWYYARCRFYRMLCEIYEKYRGEKIDIEYEKFQREHAYMIDILPEYLDGGEAVTYLKEALFDKLDKWPTKAKDKQALRQKMRELFHIEGNKYPHWVQECEWPVLNGKPMKYVKRTSKRGSDLVEFHFVDVDTGEVKVIEQFY